MKPKISLVLDERRSKKKNLYPVKLRVYDPRRSKAKLYPINLDLSCEDFKYAWLNWDNKKPNKAFLKIHEELMAITVEAIEKTNELNSFNFEDFEKKMSNGNSGGLNILHWFKERIAEFSERNQFSQRDIYSSCVAMMKDFRKSKTEKIPESILFIDITVKWLKDFEDYMIDLGRSPTTVSFYTRAIQAVFNIAIEQHAIEPDIYPFGKNKYKKPSVRKVKKALSNDDLKKLIKCKPISPLQAQAKDFWLFSFYTAGMNFTDILQLKCKDIDQDKIIFIRTKNLNTSRDAIKEQQVPLSKVAKDIIRKHGKLDGKPNQFVFGILNNEMSEEQTYKKIKNFTRFVNQHLKKLAKSLGLPQEISTYWARHSFATKSIRAGFSLEMVGKAFENSGNKVTRGYFAGFEDEAVSKMILDVTNIK